MNQIKMNKDQENMFKLTIFTLIVLLLDYHYLFVDWYVYSWYLLFAFMVDVSLRINFPSFIASIFEIIIMGKLLHLLLPVWFVGEIKTGFYQFLQ